MKRIGLLLLSLILLACFSVVGCSDDNVGVPDAKVKEDGKTTTPDGPVADSPQPDQFDWPDQGQDQTIWPDLYTGPVPYGCTSDADCFGKKCCSTPWGVKLCAPSCK